MTRKELGYLASLDVPLSKPLGTCLLLTLYVVLIIKSIRYYVVPTLSYKRSMYSLVLRIRQCSRHTNIWHGLLTYIVCTINADCLFEIGTL